MCTTLMKWRFSLKPCCGLGCVTTQTPARTPRLGQCHNTLTPARTPRLGLCHNTLTPARTPRLGLCHNTAMPARTPRLRLCHTDTSNNTKTWAVSQHTDTSKNTKAWAVLQHIDTLHQLNALFFTFSKVLASHRLSHWGCQIWTLYTTWPYWRLAIDKIWLSCDVWSVLSFQRHLHCTVSKTMDFPSLKLVKITQRNSCFGSCWWLMHKRNTWNESGTYGLFS